MSISTPVLLVVEDELPLLESIITKARLAGFEVVSARGVAEAEEFLKDIPSIDAVWLDHFLPDHLGLELVKFMRHEPKWKTTPIYLVTNVVEPGVVNQYMKAGISGYYTKILVKLGDVMRDIRSRLAAA